jgi:hypothetical protein
MNAGKETEPAKESREARADASSPSPRDPESERRDEPGDFRETTERGYGWGV